MDGYLWLSMLLSMVVEIESRLSTVQAKPNNCSLLRDDNEVSKRSSVSSALELMIYCSSHYGTIPDYRRRDYSGSIRFQELSIIIKKRDKDAKKKSSTFNPVWCVSH